MTCTKDCSHCIYGIPIQKFKCGDPNATCNGNCENCIHKIITSEKWSCNARLAYGIKGGITQ